MVNRVVPRDRLDEETAAVADRIAEMDGFGLAITKMAVNHAEDLMGLRAGIDYSYALHQLSHSHAAEVGAEFDPNKVREGFRSSQ